MARIRTPLLEGWQFAQTRSPLEQPGENQWRPVTLPHDWAAGTAAQQEAGASQGFLERRQVGWYRQEIRIRKIRPDRKLFLCFDGVSEYATVYLNGTKLGRHHYGYTPFRYELTPGLQEGANQILVRVDCTAEPADRWYSGCGIYRDVHILDVPANGLDERKITVQCRLIDEGALVSVDCGLDAAIRVRLHLPDGRLKEAEGTRKAVLTVGRPPLWTAEHPQLCGLTVELADRTDTVRQRIGLRETVFTPEGFRVNGERVQLRGVCVHQDIACLGVAAPAELWRQRLRALKGIGVNALRPAHHMFSGAFMDLCDELGFYVIEESFDKWRSGLYRRYFQKDWHSDLAAMVERDRNRPSVVLWTVGNEVEDQGSPEMLNTLSMLAGEVRGMDPTRPVGCAMLPWYAGDRIETLKAAAPLVDVLCLNYHEQWLDEIHAALPNMPIVNTEAYPWFMSSPEDIHNLVERLPVAFAEERPWCAGSFIWAGYDYLGESMGWPSKGWTGSLARSDGRPRFSWWVMKARWTQEPMVRLGILDSALGDEFAPDHWATPPYLPCWDFPQLHKGVLPCAVATNCERVEIRLGERLIRLAPPVDGICRGWIPWQSGTVEARGYIGEKLAAVHRLTTPGESSMLAFVRPPDRAPAQAGWCVKLHVQATDGAENPCVRETRRVRFEVSGPAEILGTDNGNLMEPTPYASASVPLWLGGASVVVRLRGTPGTVTVRALAEDLRPAACTLNVEQVI